MFKFKKTYIDIFGIILLLFVLHYTYRAFEERYYLSDDVEYTIAKTTKFSGKRGRENNVTYTYYVDNQKYSSGFQRDYKDKNALNRFYIVKYSTKKPKYNKIDLAKEIKDTLKIREAGFKNYGK